MASTVVLNGVNYQIPDVGDTPPGVNWGTQLNAYLIALATAYGNTSPGFLDFVDVTTSPITGVSGKLYFVDTSGARTINLPVPANNAYIIVKDTTGSASSNNITIAQNASENIDGVAASKTLDLDYGSWIIVSDGTDWFSVIDWSRVTTIADAQTLTGAKTLSALLTASAGIATTDIDAGSSGAAGSVDVFPTTAAKGKLSLLAADSAGDTNTIITNASQAGARTYTIPDAGASASFVMTAGTQVLSGATTLTLGLTISAVTNQFVLGTTATVTITSPAPAASRVYTIIDAGAAASFVMTAGDQTLTGDMRFDGNNAMGGAPITSPSILLAAYHGTSDATTYKAQRWLAGGGSTYTETIQETNTAIASAADIVDVPQEGCLVLVVGVEGSNRFFDLVMAGVLSTTPTVAAAHTISGSPAARTYTISSGSLQLAMASGTYSVNTFGIATRGR